MVSGLKATYNIHVGCIFTYSITKQPQTNSNSQTGSDISVKHYKGTHGAFYSKRMGRLKAPEDFPVFGGSLDSWLSPECFHGKKRNNNK